MPRKNHKRRVAVVNELAALSNKHYRLATDQDWSVYFADQARYSDLVKEINTL